MSKNLYRHFKTIDELDAEYKLDKFVKDIHNCTALYDKWSEESRKKLTCDLDVPYGYLRDETLDIFSAKSKKPCPTLVFFHGGYWRKRSSKHSSFVADHFVSNGINFISVNFSLCPQVTIDEIVRQTRSSVYWIYKNAEKLNIDKDNIFLSGHSCGGHISAMIALTDWKEDYGLDINPIRGILPIGGVFDLYPLQYTFIQSALQLHPQNIFKYSPIHHIKELDTKSMVIFGSNESSEFIRQSTEFFDLWGKAGNRSEILIIPECHHFDLMFGIRDPKSLIFTKMLEFIRS